MSLPGLPSASAFAEQHDAVRRLLEGVLHGAAKTTAEVRAAIAFGGNDPEDARGILDKVRRHAWRVTEEDVAALKASGRSEDEIFELIICASIGASLTRLERGLNAIASAAQEQEKPNAAPRTAELG
jgi:hypothetical protein